MNIHFKFPHLLCLFQLICRFLQGSSAESVDDLLDKALRVAAVASRNEIYSCQNEEKLLQECDKLYPMQKMTQEDLDVLRTAFLAEQLSADVVERVMNDVFRKFTDDHRLDEMFKAAVRMCGRARGHLMINNSFFIHL